MKRRPGSTAGSSPEKRSATGSQIGVATLGSGAVESHVDDPDASKSFHEGLQEMVVSLSQRLGDAEKEANRLRADNKKLQSDLDEKRKANSDGALLQCLTSIVKVENAIDAEIKSRSAPKSMPMKRVLIKRPRTCAEPVKQPEHPSGFDVWLRSVHLSQRENATSDEGDEDRDDDDRDSDTPSVYSSNVDLDNASEMWRSLKKSERNMWRKRAREYSVDPDNWHQYRAMLSIKRYANAHRNEAILEDLKSMSLQELEALQNEMSSGDIITRLCKEDWNHFSDPDGIDTDEDESDTDEEDDGDFEDEEKEDAVAN